jgi:hypothetical protein
MASSQNEKVSDYTSEEETELENSHATAARVDLQDVRHEVGDEEVFHNQKGYDSHIIFKHRELRCVFIY